MASQVSWAQAVVLRTADNGFDNPAQADLDDVQTHWDQAYGAALPAKLAAAGIADTPDNRAIVQMIATLSPGTPSGQLTRACKFFSAVDPLA